MKKKKLLKRNLLLLAQGLTLLLLSLPIKAQGEQRPFVDSIGCKQKYAATIEMKKGYLSGICILAVEDDCFRASLFNEFGISALDFTYLQAKRKVKLQHVIKMLDKWYIRKVLKRDLAHVVDNLLEGIPTYVDEKYHIKYQFTLLNDTKETNDATEE